MATQNLMLLAQVAEKELRHELMLPYVQQYMKIWADYLETNNVNVSLNDIYTNTNIAWHNVNSTFNHSSKTIDQQHLSNLFFAHTEAFKNLSTVVRKHQCR